MLKLSTFIFCIIYHFGQRNVVSVVIFSLGNPTEQGEACFVRLRLDLNVSFV